MPKIVIITVLHLILALAGGYALGMSVFAAGFSSSEGLKSTYSFLAYAWQVLNAPAGVYAFHAKTISWLVFGALQLLTSFLWANALAILWSCYKGNWHNLSFKRDAAKRGAP